MPRRRNFDLELGADLSELTPQASPECAIPLSDAVPEPAPTPRMSVRCVVAATSKLGPPSLFACRVLCTQEQFNEGDHCEAARDAADDAGYTDPMVVFDEFDGPLGLFRITAWGLSAYTTECPTEGS